MTQSRKLPAWQILMVMIWIQLAGALMQFVILTNEGGWSLPMFALCQSILLAVQAFAVPPLMRSVDRIPEWTYPQQTAGNDRWWKIGFGAAILLYVLAVFLIGRPGHDGPDQRWQLEQAKTGRYDDWHPALHTLLAFAMPRFVTGGWQDAPLLFQALAMGAVLWWLACAYLRFGKHREALMVILWLAINPSIAKLFTGVWKDNAFAAVCLAATLLCVDCIADPVHAQKPGRLLALSAMLALACIFRHNGILFALPLAIAAAFCLPRKKWMLLIGAMLAIVLFVRVPLYGVLGVKSPGSRTMETAGLPLSVIGTVAVEAPEAMDEETKAMVYAIATPEQWAADFATGSFNSIKFLPYSNLEVLDGYTTMQLVGMMFRCFRNAPMAAMRGLATLCYMVVAPDAPTVWAGGAMRLALGSIGNLFFSTGFTIVVLLVLALGRSMHWKGRKMRRLLFALPLLCYDMGTMLFLSGNDHRFFLVNLMTLPAFALIFLVRQEEE